MLHTFWCQSLIPPHFIQSCWRDYFFFPDPNNSPPPFFFETRNSYHSAKTTALLKLNGYLFYNSSQEWIMGPPSPWRSLRGRILSSHSCHLGLRVFVSNTQSSNGAGSDLKSDSTDSVAIFFNHITVHSEVKILASLTDRDRQSTSKQLYNFYVYERNSWRNQFLAAPLNGHLLNTT